MKKTLTLLCTILLFGLTSCNNDDDNDCQGIDCLPPATQTGEGTFACLVDGQPFIDNSGSFNCFYQLINSEYFFGIGAIDENFQNTPYPKSLNINTFNKSIQEGETLFLLEPLDGNAFGEGFFTTSNITGIDSFTNTIMTGELIITKLDFQSNIVSATFWYDLENPITGDTIQIREGRFDTLFTQ